MSRIGINYQDVAKAAAKLQGLNENPTVDRVREILGTGSKSTIARHLKEWKGSSGDVAAANSLPTELVAIVSGLWERLQNDAEQQILNYRTDANQQVQNLETNLKQIQNKNTELQNQCHKFEELLFVSTENYKNTEQALKDETVVVQKQQMQISSLENQLSLQQEENAKLHILLRNMQNNLEHYQEATQKLQQDQILNLDKQRVHFEQELEISRQQLASAIWVEQNLMLQNQQLQQQLSVLMSIKEDNKKLEFNCKEFELKTGLLQQKYDDLLSVSQRMNHDLEAKTKHNIEIAQENAVANSRIHALENLLKSSEDKISTLRQEQMFLTMQKAQTEAALKAFKEPCQT